MRFGRRTDGGCGVAGTGSGKRGLGWFREFARKDENVGGAFAISMASVKWESVLCVAYDVRGRPVFGILHPAFLGKSPNCV